MSRVRGYGERFEYLLDLGNDLTSAWGPFRRWLPPRDVKIRAPFIVLWTISGVIVVPCGALAAVTLIYIIVGRPAWFPAVAAGRLPFLFVVTYYAGWVTHRAGFLLFYLAPALLVLLNASAVLAWNLRARRLQRESLSQEARPEFGYGVWPPPPTDRK